MRNGQYFLWNPIHLYGIEGSTEGSYADQNAKTFLGYLAGTSQPAGTTQTSVETAVLNHNIPVCAMNVARDGDLGPEYAVTPDDPCGCYFDYANTGVTTCATCDDSTPCASGTCRYGFCEAY